MTKSFRIAIYGPPNTGKSYLLKRIYELYKEASVHGIRYLGGSKRTGIDYCTFKLGDIKYEFYAPPGSSYVKVFRNKIIKNADGIVFMALPARHYLDKVSSFMLDLKKILFSKYGSLTERLPIVFLLNYTKTMINPNEALTPKEFMEALNLPKNTIIYKLDLDDEKTIRGLFGRLVHLTLLWKTDKKKYYMEYDRWVAETMAKYLREVKKEAATPPEIKPPVREEISIPEAPEIPSMEYASPKEEKVLPTRELTLKDVPLHLKKKLLENYINEVVIIDFDRALGHVPVGYVFKHGKVLNYVFDPVFLTELGIIAKHSLGFILRDGFTFIGVVPLLNQGLVILETTISHMKKILGIVRRLRRPMQNLSASQFDRILEVIDRTL